MASRACSSHAFFVHLITGPADPLDSLSGGRGGLDLACLIGIQQS